MKNKKQVYFLGLLVLVIWGFIIYRIFAAVSDKEEPLTAPLSYAKEPYDDYTLPKDTTRLPSGYRDPFGLVQPKDTTPAKTPKVITANNRLPAVILGINWGAINYLGYIRNPGSKKLIAIMHINGKEVMMAEGESAEQVKLIKNLRDSIKINYHGKNKFITIKPAV